MYNKFMDERNLNIITDGYFEMRDNKELIASVHGKMVKDGYPKICKRCGKKVTTYFETDYIDEQDNEICAVYGLSCFKKIATFDPSTFAI